MVIPTYTSVGTTGRHPSGTLPLRMIRPTRRTDHLCGGDAIEIDAQETADSADANTTVSKQ
jgi:hypothetical protein